ncbi:hypothetical protein [Streptomyces sp. NPDC051662]|uniref:hypothetical protein n=1 Tax=Streptomyces sp. NPDC051662 TaxID=3154750 RepID=UPI003415CB4C
MSDTTLIQLPGDLAGKNARESGGGDLVIRTTTQTSGVPRICCYPGYDLRRLLELPDQPAATDGGPEERVRCDSDGHRVREPQLGHPRVRFLGQLHLQLRELFLAQPPAPSGRWTAV